MTPNPEMVMMAQEDDSLMKALQAADLVIPDGIGLILVSKLKKKGLIERVTGIETMAELLEICHHAGKSFFLLGGKPGRVEKAIETILERYPGIGKAFGHHGYFDCDDEIVEKIQRLKPDVIFVCLGSPKQERWIHHHRHCFPETSVMIGVGGSVDVYAGAVRRAPVIFRKLGLEWLYRVIQEPERIKRLAVLPAFLWKGIRM